MSIDRHEAIHRRRRIIFNDDNEAIGQERSTTPEAYLSHRLDHVIDTQVDSVWLSFVGGADVLLYDTKVGEIADSGPWPGVRKPGEETVHWRNIKALLDRDTDTLRVVLDFCRKHGLEMFASYRMNMIQDTWQRSFRTKWKREHPEFCLGERGSYVNSDNDDLHLCWSALDWEHEAVRDQRLAVIEEVCSGYDVDGMELDFWRWPILFKPTLEQKPVEQRHLDVMTDFMRRVRSRMMEIESERGRPLLLAPRVFDTLEVNRRMGLDVETWLEEGLLDILVVGGDYTYYSISVSEWAELAHRYDVPLYVCLYRSTTVEQDRAVTSYHFSCGSDGVYTFNFKLPRHVPPIKEIGDPQLIDRRNKHYVMNHSSKSVCLRNGCAPGLLPVRMEEDRPTTAKLLIGDDVQAAADEDALMELRLRLSLTNFDPYQDEVTAVLNGRELRRPRPVEPENPWTVRGSAPEWKGIEDRVRSLEFTVFTIYTDIPVEPTVTKGENSIDVTLRPRTSGLTGPVDLVGVELFIRYR